MDKKKRYLFVINLFISGIGVVFISAALGTEYWVSADAVRNVGDDIKDTIINSTDGDPGTRLTGKVNIGLFAGFKEIDYAFGTRSGDIKIDCITSENLCGFIWADRGTSESQALELQLSLTRYEESVQAFTNSNGTTEQPADHGLFSYTLWVLTILFAAAAILWGLVSMVFAGINAGTRPIETITGPLGLYIWNSIAALCSLLCMVMYIILFALDLSKNVMSPDDLQNFWSSDDMANLDYSFYFIMIATVMFLVNLLILVLLRADCKLLSSRYSTSMGEKGMDGVMMY